MLVGKKTQWSAVAGIAALMLISGNALGAVVLGAAGAGHTVVDTRPPYCDATVSGVIPSVLDIDDGDDVLCYFNVSWDDGRSGGSSTATHYYNMTLSYTKVTGDQFTERTEYTNGDDSGSASLQDTVVNVEEGESILVVWTASVSVPGYCSAFDQKNGSIQLV